MMNMMIIIREEKRYSVTNLDDSILEVKINKLDEQQTEKVSNEVNMIFFGPLWVLPLI